MKTDNALRQELPKVSLYAALSLFLTLTLAHGFMRYTSPDREVSVTSPSKICTYREPEAKKYRDAVCDIYGEVRQFHTMHCAAILNTVAHCWQRHQVMRRSA